MIDDVSIDGEFFDEDFFAYREDADVSWRAQLLGWNCLYTPSAVAFPRAQCPAIQSPAGTRSPESAFSENRFLMRIKNIDPQLYRRHWWSITKRDVLIVAGCVLREWSSLPAFWFVLRRWPKTWAKRKEIMRRRKVEPRDIVRWFA